jgi:small subunit ribosomal protein S7
MPRKNRGSLKREIAPDPKFGDLNVAKFINCLMWDGKKSVSEIVFYQTLDILAQRTKEDPPWKSAPGGSAAPPTRFPRR